MLRHQVPARTNHPIFQLLQELGTGDVLYIQLRLDEGGEVRQDVSGELFRRILGKL
jgi:hypothetical protein